MIYDHVSGLIFRKTQGATLMTPETTLAFEIALWVGVSALVSTIGLVFWSVFEA